MSKRSPIGKVALSAFLVSTAVSSMAAVNSGSTGVDGAFNPTASTVVQIPPSGVFNYTSVNIPTGVTITYKKNASNTPVTILASGDVTVAGTIDVGAAPGTGDASAGGIGGPGGYDGGHGGYPIGTTYWTNGATGPSIGRAGVGPGAGAAGIVIKPGLTSYGADMNAANGGGGAFGFSTPAQPTTSTICGATPGVQYGNATLLPLIGGSGGGGGAAGSVVAGSGGGGGGGAILIASSGAISVTGTIRANGGNPTVSVGAGLGGGGSGGAIRLVATTINGNGTISASGGGSAISTSSYSGYYTCATSAANSGSVGRIRLEAETVTRTAVTSPVYSSDTPGTIVVPGATPSLTIASVGGIAVPANPNGYSDVAIASSANPMTVVFTTSGVTVGSTITLNIVPPLGLATSANSAPTTGTADSATSSVSVSLPIGANTLQATVTYAVSSANGIAMSRFTGAEQVAQVRLNSTLGGESTATLITVSGKEFTVPAASLANL